MGQWDAVVVAVRRGHDTKELRDEIRLLQELKIFSADEVIFVEDACDDSGSAGSLLNALLVTAERLSAKAGYSVLSEDVFHNSSVLLLLIGPNEGAFHPMSSPETWLQLPDTVIARQLKNVDILEAPGQKGMWICGTESSFVLDAKPPDQLSDQAISVFTFPWETDTLHGSYLTDSQGNLKGIEYPTSQPGPSPLVLTLLYFPPAVTATVLSLHSAHPLSASTYYGEDTGTLGLKLSLFFDLLMATCLERRDYLESEIGREKIHQHGQLRRDARQIIWQRMRAVEAKLVHLSAHDYCYLQQKEDRTLQVLRSCWIENLCKRTGENLSDRSRKMDTLGTLATLHDVFGDGVRQKVMTSLWEAIQKDETVGARAFYALSEFLYILAHKKGGLRMGPVANPSFSRIFQEMRHSADHRPWIKELFQVVERDWMSDEYKLVRAARHVEAAAQIIYGKRTVALKPKIKWERFQGGGGVRVRSAARVDILGGWLDTPPITYETTPSAVINMAISIDGQLPLSCQLEPTQTPGITFTSEQRTDTFASSAEVVTTASRPSDHGALLCACFVSLGLLDGAAAPPLPSILQSFYSSPGIHVTCSSALPHGSGLGTSSILACCILSALLGQIPEREVLVHLVLYVEHLLTTGGGWQDQVGGIYPGLKIGEFKGTVTARRIEIRAEFEREINQRLVLIYTGKTRLAKNLLQEVLRNWYAGGEVVQLMQSMQTELSSCESLLLKGTFPSRHVELYYDVKKKLATGCEPPQVGSLISLLKSRKIAEAAWLAGAGGGGFLYVWLSPGKGLDDVKGTLQSGGMTVHSIEVCDKPLVLEKL